MPRRLQPDGFLSKLGTGAFVVAADRVTVKLSPSEPSAEGDATTWPCALTIVMAVALLPLMETCVPLWVVAPPLNCTVPKLSNGKTL